MASKDELDSRPDREDPMNGEPRKLYIIMDG